MIRFRVEPPNPPTLSARWAPRACTLSSFAAWLLVGCEATSSLPAAAPASATAPAATTAAGAGSDRAAAAPTPHAEARGAGECPRAPRFEANAVATEVSCLLARYLRIDTTNPPGHELAAAAFLKAVLARDGIDGEIIESAPGRANLFARLPGTAADQALMLVHHMDVVPANASEWSVPPFAGLEKDGVLWGRGSLDDKASGIAELVTLAIWKRLGTAPPRTLELLAVADEESGSAFGSRWLVEHRKDLFRGVSYVLNEGGGVLEVEGGSAVYNVEVAQKAPLWLRVTAQGPAGHGSAPEPNTAANVLIRALGRVAQLHFPIVVLPEVQAMFAARSAAAPEPKRTLYRDLRATLADPKRRAEFLKDPRDAALVQNTVAITMLNGSPKENVISEHASAVLDVRLLPGQDAAAVTQKLREIMAEPALQIETLLSWRGSASSANTPLFGAIQRLAQARDPGAPVTANMIAGFTDCNAFRALDLVCYGFFPLHVSMDDVRHVHGTDERVRIDALASAILDFSRLIAGLGPEPRAAAQSRE